MASIPVISHNVVRQAIDWHGIPSPVQVKTISSYKFPSGKVQSTLLLKFDILELFQCYTGIELHSEDNRRFREDLQGCFCRDIVVVEIYPDVRNGVIIVTLSCTVEPHDDE